MLNKKKSIKFVMPNYGEKRHKRLKARWRKQRGMDSKTRIMRKGYKAIPKIGYKNSAETRFRRQIDGIKQVVVHNKKELIEAFSMKGTSILFAHTLSARKRLAFQKMADEKRASISNKVKI